MIRNIIVLFAVSASTAYSASFDLGKAKNDVSFLAIGQPSALRIKGSAKDAKALSGILIVDGRTIEGTAVLDLTFLNTGIDMRDQHMKEKYLEVQKFPKAELILSQIAVGSVEADFSGQLKLHGVAHPVKGKTSLQIDGTTLTLGLGFSLLLKDHLIEIPSYLGIKVANEVKVTATAEGTVL